MSTPELHPDVIGVRPGHDDFDDSHTFHVDLNGTEVANASITQSEDTPNSIVLGDIRVEDTMRGKGIGRLLFEDVVEHAVEQGYQSIEAEVNNERVAHLITESFHEDNVRVYMYDGSECFPIRQVITPTVGSMILNKHREAMPFTSRADDMLPKSVYYIVDLR